MAVRLIAPVPQFVDDNGDPASGYVLRFYAPGTSTPKAVYSDAALSVEAGTSITLNASGEPDTDIYLSGRYKVALEDENGALQWTRDDFGGFLGAADLSQWVNALQATYASGTSFYVPGDYTSGDRAFEAERRVKAKGSATLYGTVSSASYNASTDRTTVTVAWDSGALVNEALTVWVGILSADNESFPTTIAHKVAIPATGNLVQQTANGDIEDSGITNPARHDDLFADWVVSGLLPATSTTLTSDTSAGAAYVTGRRITIPLTSHTYTASVDTYVDIDATGTYLFAEVATGAAAPAQPADSIRLAKVVTDATAITSVIDLRETVPSSGERTFTGPVSFTAQPSCRAYQSTLQSVAAATFTKVLFQTEVYDVGGGYDPSTSIYTAPADGTYLVSSSVYVSAQADGDRLVLYVYVDGISHSLIYSFPSGAAASNAGAGVVPVKLTKGQQVTIYLYITTVKDTVAVSENTYISIYRMG